jgi:hypothetical protein
VIIRRHVLRKKSVFPIRVVRQVMIRRHVLRKKRVFPKLHLR